MATLLTSCRASLKTRGRSCPRRSLEPAVSRSSPVACLEGTFRCGPSHHSSIKLLLADVCKVTWKLQLYLNPAELGLVPCETQHPLSGTRLTLARCDRFICDDPRLELRLQDCSSTGTGLSGKAGSLHWHLGSSSCTFLGRKGWHCLHWEERAEDESKVCIA